MKPRMLALGMVAWVLFAGCRPSPPPVSLVDAIQRNDLKSVQQHVAARSDLNVTDHRGVPALHLAILKGNMAMVEALCSGNVDLSQRNPRGTTALELAQETRKTAIAKYLESRTPSGSGGGRGLVDGGLGVSEVLNSY